MSGVNSVNREGGRLGLRVRVKLTKLSSRRDATGSASSPDKDASISALRRCEQEVGCE